MYLAFSPPDSLLREMQMRQWPVPCLHEAGGFSPAVRELLVWIGTARRSLSTSTRPTLNLLLLLRVSV